MGEAYRDFDESVAIAELGGHYEVAHMSRMSSAICSVRVGRRRNVGAVANTLRFAESAGLIKLQAEANRALAEAAYYHGDYQRAEMLCYRSLARCSLAGMTLRATGVLGLLGRVMVDGQHEAEGRAVLDLVLRLGRSQGYQLQVERAERFLANISSNTRVRSS
jgi:hypothetical protein